MITNPPANATKATKAVAGGGARVVATIFGGADLKDLFTQQGMHGILNWTNPVLSTFFFLFSNLCIYIIFYGNYSLVSVACYLAMAHLIATFLLCQVGQFMAKFQNVELPPAQQKPVPKIDEERVTAMAQTACVYINKAMSLYQCATDGSSVAVSVAMAISLYATARIFLYLSITRIAYIVFLWITLRPLARKYFSTQIDLVTGVVTRFINAIISTPTGATRYYTAVQEQAAASKKEM